MRKSIVVLLAGLTACVPSLAANPPREPTITPPATYYTGPAPQAGSAAQAASAAQAGMGNASFASVFTSPSLQALVATALQHNRELQLVEQELLIASYEVTARRGEVLPKVTLGAGLGVERVGEYTSPGTSDEAHELPANLGNFYFGGNLSWEVDIWKKLRTATKAAAARYLATVEGKHFATSQLVAEVSRLYFELLSIDRQIQIVSENQTLLERALEIVRLQKEAARTSELAVMRFAAELAKVKGHLARMRQMQLTLENKLNVVIGRPPQPIARDAADFDAAAPVLATGVPTDLLANRPDIRQAALALSAAKLDVRVARANFYPALSIDARLGYRAFNLQHLLSTPESLIFGLGSGLLGPVLNRKAITATYYMANAAQLQAVLRYEQAMLTAVGEVGTQLVALDALALAQQAQQDQVKTMRQAVEAANILFQAGRADYAEVLLTRREALEAELELVETHALAWAARVGLYQALGGGWR